MAAPESFHEEECVPAVPDAPALPPEVTARWQARFRAPRVSLPQWADDAPDRCLYTSDVSGVVEQYAWDRATGTHRQVTDRPNGTLIGTISPDGETIWWFADTDGDEFGTWRTQPFEGGPDAEPLPQVGPAYPAGLEVGRLVGAQQHRLPHRSRTQQPKHEERGHMPPEQPTDYPVPSSPRILRQSGTARQREGSVHIIPIDRKTRRVNAGKSGTPSAGIPRTGRRARRWCARRR